MVAYQLDDYLTEYDFIYTKLLEGVSKGYDMGKLAEACLILANDILEEDIVKIIEEYTEQLDQTLEDTLDLDDLL